MKNGNSFYDSTTTHYQNRRGYEIHEIPWYSIWYPKPVILKTNNLLESLLENLPFSIIRKSLFSFLSKEEKKRCGNLLSKYQR